MLGFGDIKSVRGENLGVYMIKMYWIYVKNLNIE